MSNNQNNTQEVPQVNARMENEPKEIYLVCYDLSETDKNYLPEDNDFDSLDGENVLWSPNDIGGMGTIKYVHHSRISELESDLDHCCSLYKTDTDFLKDKVAELEKQSAVYREALTDLVNLKAHKELCGKDDHYNKWQPKTWENAEQALNRKDKED